MADNAYGIEYDTIYVHTKRRHRHQRYRLGATLAAWRVVQLRLVGSGLFEVNVSVALGVEYEAACKRLVGRKTVLTASDIDDVLDYVFSVASKRKIHFLWRPVLPDPSDDMVLELAVSSNANAIVTYNKADFKGAGKFGVRLLTAQEFLQEIGESS